MRSVTSRFSNSSWSYVSEFSSACDTDPKAVGEEDSDPNTDDESSKEPSKDDDDKESKDTDDNYESFAFLQEDILC